ncbi:MAG TPA: SMP-30/gluconolactonase/LRE family protein [Bryobacteraceae bacterium]|nr:SMP-30/gluconolactonase/LRE family protein [Bryobacteraceae bacterium]
MREVLFLFIVSMGAGALAAQDFAHAEVQLIAKGLHFAEGPVWSYEGFLLYSDAPVDRLHKWTPGTGDAEAGTEPGGAYGRAFDTEGRLYTCEFRQRRVTRTDKKGKVEVLAARFEGKRLNAPNDIVVRRDGHVYFTDPAFGSQEDAKELDFYGVYHITPKGEIEAIGRWKTRPNGIALAPNGRTLYVSDSDRRNVRAYNLDGKGAASNERVAVENIQGVPDGLRTDQNGNLYVAAKGILVYAPPGAGGAKLLGAIPLAEIPSNLAFGDPDLETLYITARTSVYRVRLGVKGALPY